MKVHLLLIGLLLISLLLVSCEKDSPTEINPTEVDQPGKLSINDPKRADLYTKDLAAFPPVELVTAPNSVLAEAAGGCVTLEFTTFIPRNLITWIESGIEVTGVMSLFNSLDFLPNSPITFKRTDGSPFTLQSIFVNTISPSTLTFTSSSGDVVTTRLVDGTITFPTAGWSCITSFTASLDGGFFAEIDKVVICDCEIDVDLDIKPTSCPNPLNTKSKGVLPVAVLGSASLNVNDINVSTVQLQGVSLVRSAIEDVAAPVSNRQDDCDCTTDGPDGFADLSLKFDTQAIVAALGTVNDGDQVKLTLTGNLNDGTPIKGEDCVVIIKK